MVVSYAQTSETVFGIENLNHNSLLCTCGVCIQKTCWILNANSIQKPLFSLHKRATDVCARIARAMA